MTRGDFLVALLSVGALPWLYARHWQSEPARFALVQGARAASRQFPLAEAGRHAVEGPLGRTIVEIRDGQARIAASPCRNQRCVQAGWLSRSGAAAACVPNRVSLRITGPDGTYDSIHY